MPYVVGLTGGIGSGKSAAADEFARLGASVVDTDAIAHEFTRAGGAAIPEIRRLFGDAAIGTDGAMDRKRVRELVFADPDARAKLEGLLHPMIREVSGKRTKDSTGAYAVLVVPLLVESGDYRRRVDRVVVVDCSEELQVARVRARSNLPEEEVRRIIAAQAPRASRLAAADDIVDNSTSLVALHQQVQSLHRRYLEAAAKGVARPHS